MGVVTFDLRVWLLDMKSAYDQMCAYQINDVVIVFKQIMILFVAKSIEMQNDNHLLRGKT